MTQLGQTPYQTRLINGSTGLPRLLPEPFRARYSYPNKPTGFEFAGRVSFAKSTHRRPRRQNPPRANERVLAKNKSKRVSKIKDQGGKAIKSIFPFFIYYYYPSSVSYGTKQKLVTHRNTFLPTACGGVV